MLGLFNAPLVSALPMFSDIGSLLGRVYSGSLADETDVSALILNAYQTLDCHAACSVPMLAAPPACQTRQGSASPLLQYSGCYLTKSVTMTLIR